MVAGLAGCGGTPAEARCATDPGGWVRCAADARTPAPDLRGELVGGGTFDPAAVAGKVVVVNFWGSWCAPCRAEADDLEQTYRAVRGAGVAFLGINVRDERDKARAFELGRVTYPSRYDPAGRLAIGFDLPPNAVPATVVLDRRGRVARLLRTGVQRAALEPVVREIAAEAA
ncbi:TlpA family protein disulfide reductase [Pilimelia anulata]|uniref:TlpA family protein disulfide reductase n=1 Tax=Pilimelia anulata TaxID=53371 RepID=UPI00166382BB